MAWRSEKFPRLIFRGPIEAGSKITVGANNSLAFPRLIFRGPIEAHHRVLVALIHRYFRG